MIFYETHPVVLNIRTVPTCINCRNAEKDRDGWYACTKYRYDYLVVPKDPDEGYVYPVMIPGEGDSFVCDGWEQGEKRSIRLTINSLIKML